MQENNFLKKNVLKNNVFILVFGALGLFLLTVGVSYTLFSKVILPQKAPATSSPAISKTSQDEAMFDETLPKTEPCPLNGAYFSKPQREWWEKHRPLGIMIEDHEEARPQSGVSKADIVYEAVAEGGITRFLALFYCQDGGIVGPVRSARTYFLDFASEYGNSPFYTHVGGANTPGPANALGQIGDYGWEGYNDLNQFSIGFPTFWRDYERIGHPVATEHTMYSTTQKLWEVGASRGLTNVDKKGKNWDANFKPWKFKDDAKLADRPDAQTIKFAFWEGYNQYAVAWTYDKTNNVYKRENGGQVHIDLDNKKQLEAKNVVVLFMTERHANDGYEDNAHLLYGTKGTGNALIFFDGKKVEGTWEKTNREGKMIIRDGKGVEVQFDRGLVWFEVLPTATKVTTTL